MRRIVGLELNGRADFAARDWHMDGSPIDEPDEFEVIRGGAASVAVRLREAGTGDQIRWIGGPQAALAPHGRGQGWGPVGDASLRRLVAPAWDDPGGSGADETLRACCEALARGAEQVLVTVPDFPDFDEKRQGQIIRALQARGRRVRLVWRSVAAFHGLSSAGLLDDLAIDEAVRLLLHGPGGIEVQDLVLREDPERAGHTAPLRKGPGRLACRELGLDSLLRGARRIVREANAGVEWERCEESALPARLLVGDATAGDVEILRYWNGNWVRIEAPALQPEVLGIPTGGVFPVLNDAPERVILITPLAEELARAMVAALGGEGSIKIASANLIARGALISGRLIERGRPHYFDRLVPIEIAVQRKGEPDFEYLIEPDQIVPADREYRSRDLTGFELRRGQERIEFFVVKGGEEVRHWQVELDQAPPQRVPVVLRLRQTPGQSWAHLTVTSRVWEPLARYPRLLEWESLTPLEMTREEVLDKLRTPPPPIPERIVEHAHIARWYGDDWTGRPALDALEQSQEASPSELATTWADVLAHQCRSPITGERVWCVGTDGDLPSELPADVGRRFDAVLHRLEKFVSDAMETGQALPNNDALRALTWCFTRCPESIKDAILEALEVDAAGVFHVLCPDGHARRVLRQGAGRSITEKKRLERLFAYYAEAGDNNDVVNGLAMALSRREEAPDALSRQLVDHFSGMLAAKLAELVHEENLEVAFRNTLSAIAGLFRWRKREPRAFLAATDPVAQELRETIVQAHEQLTQAPPDALMPPRQRRAAELMEKILEYLDGFGDPNILRLIEDMDEDAGPEV